MRERERERGTEQRRREPRLSERVPLLLKSECEPSYDNGQEFANLSYRFSEKGWGKLQSQWLVISIKVMLLK